MNQSQLRSLFKSFLIQYKIAYYDPCTELCVPSPCSTGTTETLTTLNSIVLLPGNILQITYTGEDGIPQVRTTSLDSLSETITTISGNNYINEAGTSLPIIQTVESILDINGDLVVTINGIPSTPLDLPKVPIWKKEILTITTDNIIPDLSFLPITDSINLVFDGYSLCENLQYTISGQSITFDPNALGKDIIAGSLVYAQYQTI